MAVATRSREETGTKAQDEAQDASSYLQQESRRFAALYESNAYVVYNLALRITCVRDRALAATKRAFLLQLGQETSDARLTANIISTARAEAVERPKAKGGGDSEAERLLAAAAKLSIPERVALGLVSIGQGTPAMISDALGLPADKAQALRSKAEASLASALGVSKAEADEVLANWPWAQPPSELWESLYTDAYRALEHGFANRSNGVVTPILVPQTHDEDHRHHRATAALAAIADHRPRGWRGRAALAGAVLLPAAIAALLVFNGGDQNQAPAGFGIGAPAGTPATGGAKNPDGTPYQGLTPKELDKLRLDELHRLQTYSQRQQNKSLSLDKRRAAAHDAALLAQQARARLRAERSQPKPHHRKPRHHPSSGGTHHTTPPPPPPSKPKPPSKPHHSSGGSTGGGNNNSGNCLFNEKNGTYVCPT
ncbi:MAG: hypothetical protein QOG09_1455 [Solirubrobacterales bacterium]|nr:hypothetical protein [Solirubrobacterales bacterium]